MFDLFRFFMLRPPEQPIGEDKIEIAEDSILHTHMKRARAGVEPLGAMRDLAEAFTKGNDFAGQPDSIASASALNALREALRTKPHAKLAELTTLVSNAFDKPASEVAGNSEFRSSSLRPRKGGSRCSKISASRSNTCPSAS